MITENTVRYILLGGLLIALFIYHGLVTLHNMLGMPQTTDWAALSTIARILVALTIVFLTLKWSWIVKPFLGQGYIADSFKGISRQAGNPDSVDHYEDFVISQSLFWTKISGRTHLKNGSVMANWKGQMIEYDNDRKFVFAIDLETTNGRKWGIMTLRFDKGTFSGFYFPTETAETNYISTFEGMTKKMFETTQQNSANAL